MKKQIINLALLLGCCLGLTACLTESEFACHGQSMCSGYGDVTKCTQRTPGGPVNCETRSECKSSVCCEENGFCKGSNCQSVCGSMTTFNEDRLLKQKVELKDLTVDRLVTAAANADLSLAHSLGLSLGDILSLTRGEEPSDSAIQNVSQALSEKPEFARTLLSDAARAFQSQRFDANSAYWQTCIQSQKWQTNKNMNCQNTAWPGCTPDDGATLCVSKQGMERIQTYSSKK